jgi:hypothetical protein
MPTYQTTILLLVISIAAARSLSAREVSPRYDTWVDRAIDASARGEIDSAMGLFAKAHAKGMSRDSLLYFWARLYKKRSILDSALALNYAISSEVSRGLNRAALRQRAAIFDRLGWSHRANQLRDSLRTLSPAYRLGSLIPELRALAGVGYQGDVQIQDTLFPWGDQHPIDTGWGYGYHGSLRLGWRFPLTKTRSIQVSLGAGASKPNWIGAVDRITDSLQARVDLEIGARNLFGPVNLLYSAGLNHSYAGEQGLVQSLSLFYGTATPGRSVIGFVSYSNEIAADSGRMRNQHLFGSLSRTRTFGKSRLGAGLLVSGYFAAPLSDQYDMQPLAGVYYVESVNDDTLTHYVSSQFDDTIPYHDGLTYLVKLRRPGDSLPTRFIPQSFVLARPGVSFERSVAGIETELGVHGALRYYPRPVEWYEVDQRFLGDAPLALSRTEGRYYALTSLPDTEFRNREFIFIPETFDLDNPLTYEKRSRIRVDRTFRVNVSLTKTFRYLGSLTLGGFGARTWSTLRDEAPLDIPAWSWGVSLGWRAAFAPASE